MLPLSYQGTFWVPCTEGKPRRGVVGGFGFLRHLAASNGRMETDGGIGIVALEVKFLDRDRTTFCESISQGCSHRSRTKVRGSKMIRYRRSPPP